MFSNIGKEYKIHHRPNGQGIRGKKIVILGDESANGRVAAAHLVERGAKVFIAVPSARQLTAAFAAIAKTGGEWDGMVVDMRSPEEIKRFFDQAERRLGHIDVVINHLPGAADLDNGLATSQSRCIVEAIQRLQANRLSGYKGGQIINIGASGGSGVSPALRRQASDLGIRMTLITSGEGAETENPGRREQIEADDIAHCICDILNQSFGIDMIFLPGQVQQQAL
jgi:NAD(P)-dependent dehydrogenase (short-subunit alcohol dehydrogenase family)